MVFFSSSFTKKQEFYSSFCLSSLCKLKKKQINNNKKKKSVLQKTVSEGKRNGMKMGEKQMPKTGDILFP
jgi:hypothetical protein